MTMKRKDTGEEIQLNQGIGTLSYRTVLIVALLSMHPVGQQMLTQLGFPVPPNYSAQLSLEVNDIKGKLAALTTETTSLKADVADVKNDVRVVKMQLTGFQVDFEKYKNRQ